MQGLSEGISFSQKRELQIILHSLVQQEQTGKTSDQIDTQTE